MVLFFAKSLAFTSNWKNRTETGGIGLLLKINILEISQRSFLTILSVVFHGLDQSVGRASGFYPHYYWISPMSTTRPIPLSGRGRL